MSGCCFVEGSFTRGLRRKPALPSPQPTAADPEHAAYPSGTVGADLGVKTLAVPSKGDPIPGPRANTALLKRVRRTSRAMSRKQRQSRNRDRARRRLARLH
jgi:putative transposase